MRLLFELDANNHSRCTHDHVRNSARAIIIRDGLLAMVHSFKYDYYKFPGGGIRTGEEPVDALIRETREEAGLTVIPHTIREFGYVHRVERSLSDPSERFIQDNYYYLCEVEDEQIAQDLDDYEAEERFTLEYVEAEKAIEKDRHVGPTTYSQLMFEREARVLEMLRDEGYLTRMDVSALSDEYHIRVLDSSDVDEVVSLCAGNPQFYQYCPPFVSRQSILKDMKALPNRKQLFDKYYLGYYLDDRLIAVLDLINRCPDDDKAFIGFFMMDADLQNQGVGSAIIDELCTKLRGRGLSAVRLGWVKGNPQAEHFWKKNGFTETGLSYDTDDYTVIIAQRIL
ncbi:MAG: GNAT family N-acetyltransferase [Erysipelotrichaceae bacterium]|nr:GNAT family N-acetyltransferase [Erysipelotrichaceae bacterium]